ncbi:type I secretion outer membrane protein [Clostridium sp. CAG:768]|nr:type I secretion outer membrane protein [Clostridium sp. CAG:768]
MKIHIKAIALTICLFYTISAAFAIEQMSVEKNAILNIKDCITIALQNSPKIKKARYNYGIAKGNLGIAKSEYFPTLGIGTGYNITDNNNNRRSTNTNIYSAEANINQLIWNFGKTNANIKMYNFDRVAALYEFEDMVLETIFGVKTNYYGVLAAKATLDVNRANVQINERNYQRTKAYFEEGIKSKIDLVNAEVYLSDSKVTLVESEKAYKNALVQLNNSMYIAFAPEYEIENTETFNFQNNYAPVNLEKIDEKKDLSKPPKDVNNAFLTSQVEKINVLDNYKFKPFPYTFEESVNLAYKNRPDLKAYDATLKAMQESLKYTKREYLPEISATAGYGYRDQYNTNSFNVGINLSSNVNIKGQKHKIDNAKIQVQLAENEIDQAKQDIYFEVQNLYINMMQLEKQIPLLAVKVKQTLENFELADGRYAVGLGDYIELQDAKVNYNNAQVSYVQTVYNYNVARANLERAIALPQEVTTSIEDK